MPENAKSAKGSRRPGKLAQLVYLQRVLDSLNSPISLAEDWILPADLPEFVKQIDKRVRALSGFIDGYWKKRHGVLRQEDDRENAGLVEQELIYARKNLVFLDKLRAAQIGAATEFLAEKEELRRLRSGELSEGAR